MKTAAVNKLENKSQVVGYQISVDNCRLDVCAIAVLICAPVWLPQCRLRHATPSDKRGTKSRFGHSELMVPTERATKELISFGVRFKTVHKVKVKLWHLKVR